MCCVRQVTGPFAGVSVCVSRYIVVMVLGQKEEVQGYTANDAVWEAVGVGALAGIAREVDCFHLSRLRPMRPANAANATKSTPCK